MPTDIELDRLEQLVASGALAAIESSPCYSFALVTGSDGTLLRRVPASALDRDGDRRVAEIMELDPSTVRPHTAADQLADRLAEQDVRWAIVTTPEGRLLGAAWREDLERAAAG